MKSKNRRIEKSKNVHVRSGSALLVVLGMLAFMLFSGLAFSVYMRQSRLPTSFLRRTVATRQLAKAALAEAIEEIDTAIGNDPHPNLHVGSYQAGVITNIWDHRVFIGVGSSSQSNGNGQSANAQNTYPLLVDPSDTVPTLTLEGLAYLPPNLINEVRYYSQRTPTAKWHPFWFDSGRYAYTAIDVSDYFDIHRVYANKPRSSGHRVSLAHLFEQGADHSGPPDSSNVTAWDKFMEEYRPYDEDGKDTGKMPLVSLADFTVAMGEGGVAGLKSPFRNFLNGELLYESDNPEDAKVEKYRNMTFVTDGWFPTTTGNTTPNTNREKRDLTAYQPFRETELNGSSVPAMVSKVMEYSSAIVGAGGNGADLSRHLSRLGLVQLWDYLDANRVPVSLAVPTLERVPMIVGMELSTLPNIKIECATSGVNTPFNPTTGTPAVNTQSFTYKLLLDGAVGVNLLAAYPFRDHGIDDNENFTIDGRVALFLTVKDENMTLRPGDSNPGLHLTQTLLGSGNNSVINSSVLSFALTAVQINGSDIAGTGVAPVKKLALRGTIDGIAETEFFKVMYQWNTLPVPNPSGTGFTFTYQSANAAIGAPAASGLAPVASGTAATFTALTSNGSVSPNFVGSFPSMIQNGIEVKVNAAVWLRVKYDDEYMREKTVDLVPACALDDQEFNGANNDGDSSAIQGFSGEPYPLMRYDVKANDQDAFMVRGVTTPGVTDYQLTIEKPKVICNDPRYNHLPENWYKIAGEGLQEQDWIDETAKMLGQGEAGNKCDSDFYLFTSDQGYLQSVYELAFLPRLTSLEQNDTWGFYGYYPATWTRTAFGSQPSDAKDYNVMWRTYRCFDSNGNTADPFEEIGLTCGENGQKVDPYSDTTAVLLAALANTPHDWRVSSTNEKYAVIKAGEMDDAVAFNKNHAWNDYCTGDPNGKMCWDCLEAIAEEFKAKVRKAGNWEDGFADLAWSKESNKILDFEETDFDEDADSPMYGVDKKFLYGFWHDSFAARQQLFLIFVRAEPMMMGGGVSGQVPPQLGARAVALVWRDPTKTQPRSGSGSGGSSTTLANPHRTRILFYHQFD